MPATINTKEILDAFPAPFEGTGEKGERKWILSQADKPAMDGAVAAVRAGGKEAIGQLIGLLADTDPTADSKVRHVLHALVIDAGKWEPNQRAALAEQLAVAARDEKPAEVRAFLIRQVQLIGGKEVIPALAKLLGDENLVAAASAAMLSIKDGAADAFRGALAASTGRARQQIVQALGDLKDAPSAEWIRKSLTDADSDTRIVAARALAQIGDAGSIDLLTRAAETDGYERTAMAKALLVLAENLVAAKQPEAARRVYGYLQESRKDPSENYIRDVARDAAVKAG